MYAYVLWCAAAAACACVVGILLLIETNHLITYGGVANSLEYDPNGSSQIEFE